jgi:hypothetical protein
MVSEEYPTYGFISSFVLANLVQILKIDLPFDPNFVT